MPDREKISYEIDPHNRLIAKKTGRLSDVKRFRKVLDGRFKIDKDNSFTYHIKKSSGIDIPQQVKLSGNYSLDKDHNLIFTLNKWNNQVVGNRLIIKGQLLDAKSDELSFSAGTRDVTGNKKVYILKLNGSWKADKYNRLSFEVTKESGAEDNLILQGAWQVNDNNQIIYTYGKESLLTFKGYWDISEKHKITYVLNKQINSGFDFQIGLLKPVKRGIEYKINIGANPKAKILALSGQWRINERLGLLFEAPYEGKKIKSFSFGADFKLTQKDTVELKLKNNKGQGLDASLKLSRNILKGAGEAFIKALKEGKEVSLSAGAGFRW